MKSYLLAAVSMLLLSACSKKETKGNLHISGTVKGLKKGTLYIQKIKDTMLVAVDTIKIDGSSDFTSDLEIASPEMYYLFLDRGVTNSIDNNIPFFVEPGHIHIETTLDHFLSDAHITGSKNQQKYEEYRKVVTRFNDQDLTWTQSKFYAFKNNDTKKIDSLQALQQASMNKRYLYTTNFALNNRDYEVAPFVTLSEIPNINIKFLDTIQKSMSPKVSGSYYGKKLTAFLAERKRAESKK